MIVKPETLKDGRIILHITENDGSPITSQELSTEQSTGMFHSWVRKIMKEQKTNILVIELEPEQKELVIQLRDMKPEVEPKNTEKKDDK